MSRLGIALFSLALMTGGAFAYYKLNSPLPALAQNLPKLATEADLELDRRVREHFPLGTSTTSLQSALVQQGWGHVQFGSGFHYVSFRRSTGPLSTEVAGIRWKEENGSLSEIHAAYYHDMAVP